MTEERLPHGFKVRVGADVRIHDGGRTLVGGSPLRVLRLRGPAEPMSRGSVVEVQDRVSGVVAEHLLAAGLGVPLADRPADPDEVTVVVPVRDRADRLDRLLAALADGPAVVVVDDASRDPAAVAAVAARHAAHLVVLPSNLGPAGARNAGLAEVTTPYVAFVDSDVVVDATSLLALAAHFADPHVAAVAPRVRGAARHDRPRRFERWDVEGLSLDLGDRPALVRPWSRVGWLPSACLMVRTADLSAAGVAGFAPGRRVGEDVDLVWRLIAAGRQVRYDPAYEATHDSRGTWSTWLGRKAFYGTGGAWLARRHGDWIAPAVLSPVPVVGMVALLAQRRWSAPVALAAYVVVRARLRRALPDTPDRAVVARELAAEVSVSTLRQTVHLVLRHWWPGAAAGAVVSRRARRVVLAAAVWDLLDHREVSPLRAPEAFLARRADDLAYGAGLWWGALRDRSARVLVPRLTGWPFPAEASSDQPKTSHESALPSALRTAWRPWSVQTAGCPGARS